MVAPSPAPGYRWTLARAPVAPTLVTSAVAFGFSTAGTMVPHPFRAAGLALACWLTAPDLQAQGPFSPRLDLSLGRHTIRTIYEGATRTIESRENESNYLASMALGLGISRVVTGDVTYRSSFGGDWTLRMMSLGLTVRSRGRVGAYFRVALGAIWSDQVDTCMGFACPGTKDEGQPGYEFSIGADFPVGGRFSVGPVFWLSRSAGGLPAYRSLGLGLHVGVF